MKILIVDDNLEMLSSICSLLKKNKIISLPASSAKRALGMAFQKIPDFIIIDFPMPEMDGFEFCELLRLNPATSDIPVVFMSSDYSTFNDHKLKKAGVIDIINKPINDHEFISKINSYFNYSKKKKNIQFHRN